MYLPEHQIFPASRRAFFGKLGSLWCFLFGHVTTPVLATSSVVPSQLKNIQFPMALVGTKQVKLPETGGLESRVWVVPLSRYMCGK